MAITIDAREIAEDPSGVLFSCSAPRLGTTAVPQQEGWP